MSDLVQRLSTLSPEKRAILQKKLLEKRGVVKPAPLPVITRRAGFGPCPVSFGQELMWLLDQLTPGISAYNVPRVLRLRGRLDLEALKKSLAGVLQRHSILRTTYSVSDGVPLQVVNEEACVDLRETDLSGLAPEQREAEALRIAIEESDKCFDLKRDLMMRTLLIRLGPEEHIFVLVTHHIASDGVSRTLLFRELAEHYEAFTKGLEPKLPELPIQFADFAVWQRNWFKEEILQTQLEYWEKQLAGAPPVLELPADHPRPAVQTYTGARLSTSYTKATAVKLREFGQKEGVTQFMLLLAVFKVLLHRYSGQEDIVVGTPMSGRSWTEIENVIGYFSNSLVLRTSFAGNPSFRQLLQRVREMALGAFSHQDLPFEKLVEKLQPERDLSRSAIYQIMFGVGHARDDEANLPGLTVTPLNAERGTAKFDMTFGMRETGDALNAGCEFSTDLFEAAAIKRMFAHLGVLMEGIAANPDQPVGELPLLTEAERQQVLSDWNGTRADFPGHQSVHQLFEEQAASTPERVAVVFENQALTYRELNARANQVAHRLKPSGVGPEVQVAIFIERSLEMVVGVLGILKAGGAYVAIDASMPKDRMSLIFAAAGSPVLLTTTSHLERLPPAHPEIILIEPGNADLLSQSSENLASENHPSSLAYVIYTSGSTGVPKGVMVSHANLLNSYFAWEQAYRLRDLASAHLQMANYAFDVFCGDLVRALCSGAKLVLCPLDTLLDPRRLYELMRKEKVDCAEFVPAVLRNLIQHLSETGQSLDFMRLLIAGSDAWYVQEYKSIQAFCGPQTRLINSYGLAEATVDSTYFEGGVKELSGDGLVPIGMPFPNSQCYILDGRRQLLPVGVIGELCISGPGLARGYLGRPDLTAEKFIPNPFATESGERLYCTGDMAKYRAEGTIEFLGRSDHQIKIRGFRIELGEIEALLKQNPNVTQAVVVVREDRPGQKRLIAYVVFKQEQGDSLNDVRSSLKEQLPAYMMPSAVVAISAMPLTPSGKIDRRRLPAPVAAQCESAETFEDSHDLLVQQLKQIFERVLGVSPVGVADSFFELGGHSLLAVRLIGLIEKVVGKPIPLATLIQAPTVAQLARTLRQDGWTPPWTSIVPIQPGWSKPPIFFAHGVGGNVLNFQALARRLGPDQPVYGLQSRGLDGKELPFSRVEDMATHYIGQIRSLQPEGPYYLGGMSFGGMVAYEMAQQLREQGQKISLLLMLDVAGWGYKKTIPRFELLKLALEVWMRRIRIHLINLFTMSGKERFQYVRAKKKTLKRRIKSRRWQNAYVKELNEGGILTPALRNVKEANYLAAKTYCAKPYPGHLTVFQATDKYLLHSLDTKSTWKHLASGGISVYEVPGGHLSMLDEPNVQVVAQQLKDCLTNAAGTTAPVRAQLNVDGLVVKAGLINVACSLLL